MDGWICIGSSFARLERELKKGHEKVSANESAVDRLNKQLARLIELAQVSLALTRHACRTKASQPSCRRDSLHGGVRFVP